MSKDRLDRCWSGTHKVQALLRAAVRDSDQVSMFSFGESASNLDGCIVVLKGHDVVQCFREWAERNGLLTPGKPVEDPK